MTNDLLTAAALEADTRRSGELGVRVRRTGQYLTDESISNAHEQAVKRRNEVRRAMEELPALLENMSPQSAIAKLATSRRWSEANVWEAFYELRRTRARYDVDENA